MNKNSKFKIKSNHETPKIRKHEKFIGMFRAFVLSCFRDKIFYMQKQTFQIIVFLSILLFATSGRAVVGTFTSVSFDTKGLSNFGTLTWQPSTQSAGCNLRFQIATNDDNATWSFLGPDGSVSTYYTKTPTSIWPGHSNHRYIKYRTFFISDRGDTPSLDRVVITYDVVTLIQSPKDFVFYNWPNPAFSNVTNFYYRLPEAKEIRIKIYDLSYDLIGELSGYGREGNIVWDIADVASGVYLALFKAEGYKKVTKVMVIK